jgi:hypothetical protein
MGCPSLQLISFEQTTGVTECTKYSVATEHPLSENLEVQLPLFVHSKV